MKPKYLLAGAAVLMVLGALYLYSLVMYNSGESQDITLEEEFTMPNLEDLLPQVTPYEPPAMDEETKQRYKEAGALYRDGAYENFLMEIEEFNRLLSLLRDEFDLDEYPLSLEERRRASSILATEFDEDVCIHCKLKITTAFIVYLDMMGSDEEIWRLEKEKFVDAFLISTTRTINETFEEVDTLFGIFDKRKTDIQESDNSEWKEIKLSENERLNLFLLRFFISQYSPEKSLSDTN
jgi:hypothetical protein